MERLYIPIIYSDVSYIFRNSRLASFFSKLSFISSKVYLFSTCEFISNSKLSKSRPIQCEFPNTETLIFILMVNYANIFAKKVLRSYYKQSRSLSF